MDKNAVAVVRTNSLWTSLQLGKASNKEVNTDWKSKKAIKLATNKITKIEENLNKTVKHCLN